MSFPCPLKHHVLFLCSNSALIRCLEDNYKTNRQKKSRSGRVTKKQMEILVNFVREHPALHTEKFLGPAGKVKLRELWSQVAIMANKVGPYKTQDQWKQTWKDLKLKARKKNAERKRQKQFMGDNNMDVTEFREIDKKIINIIGEESLDENPTEKTVFEIVKATDLQPKSTTTETALPVFVKVDEESGASGDGMDNEEPTEFVKVPFRASTQSQGTPTMQPADNHSMEHQQISSPVTDYRSTLEDTAAALNGMSSAMARMAAAMERIATVLEQRYIN